MPKARVQPGKKRLQFDFTTAMVERIDRCQERLGAASKNEVIRRALSLLDRCLDDELYIQNDSGEMQQLKVI